ADLDESKPPSAELLEALKEFAGIPAEASGPDSLAILAFLYMCLAISAKYGDVPSVDIVVWSELPTGAGLGSSAAYAVCLAAALLHACGAISCPLKDGEITARWTEEEMTLINSWAFQGERVIHGNPSGVDNAVGTWVSGAGQIHAACEHGSFSWCSLQLLSCALGEVLKMKDLLSRTIPPYLGGLCAETMHVFHFRWSPEIPIRKNQSVKEELFDINQHHLNVIGVGHPSLDRLCRVTASHGLHSKLTGAGGGGCG
ncbi:Mevalonate kinase, partial [Anas platyrhynchos]